MAGHGFVDQYGFSPTNGGWLIVGWIAVAPLLARSLPLGSAIVDIDDAGGASNRSVTLALFERMDLGQNGTGVIALVKDGTGHPEDLRQLTLGFGGKAFRMDRSATTTRLAEASIVEFCRGLLPAVFAGELAELQSLLRSEVYSGVGTTENLSEFVRVAIDEFIAIRPAGAVLMGWLLAWPGSVTSLALCTGRSVQEIDLDSLVPIDRPDVIDTVGRHWGFEDTRCGFLLYLPDIRDLAGPVWLRIRTLDGETAFMTVPPARLRGLPAIRRVLGDLDVDGLAIERVFGEVIGPACRALNEDRLARQPVGTRFQFGRSSENPSVSVIMTLFKRIDYLEYQIAAFSVFEDRASTEFIYVLDDPVRRSEAIAIARSVYARFEIPFTLFVLDQNFGFSVANNFGLRHAGGEKICFLNSDVFPTDPGSLARLARRLDADPDLAIAAPVLLFEDGSVQHEGMALQRIAERGSLLFPVHVRKGRRPDKNAGLLPCDMVTGACMMMRRQWALELRGFSEDYIIGDFEDADLCLRSTTLGGRIAVDHEVQLLHLERQSQASPDEKWRSNLTLYNAWLFNRIHAASLSPAHAF